MRYVRLFSIYFQDAFEQRARSLVWFLISLFGPLLMVLFWRGANYTHQQFSFSTISTYYFLLIIASAFLMSHPEEQVAEEDIHQGSLVSYLLKPFSYLLTNFMSELPWRVIQGFFGVIVVILCYILFRNVISIHASLPVIGMSICTAVLGYILGFLYKMTLGMLVFWLTEIDGILQMSDMILFTFAGYIAPLFLFPTMLDRIATFLPFSYILYFPVITFQGRVDGIYFLQIVATQLVWIVFFFTTYKILWERGLKKFTAVGQ